MGAAGSSHCVPDPPPDPLPVHPSKQAVLTPGAEAFRLRFDDARDVRADVVVLADTRRDVTLAPGDQIAASMSEYLRSSYSTLLPARDAARDRTSPNVQVLRINPLGGVEVCLELDAGLVDGTDPGQYAGSVGVTGNDLQIGSTIPVVVTFRSSRVLAIAFAFAGVLLGILVKMFTELAASQRSADAEPSRPTSAAGAFPLPSSSARLRASSGTSRSMPANPTWGENGSDWLKLFGTCFAFQIASIGSIDLARRLVGDPSAPVLFTCYGVTSPASAKRINKVIGDTFGTSPDSVLVGRPVSFCAESGPRTTARLHLMCYAVSSETIGRTVVVTNAWGVLRGSLGRRDRLCLQSSLRRSRPAVVSAPGSG